MHVRSACCVCVFVCLSLSLSLLLQVHPCGRYRHNSVVFLLGKEHNLRNLHSVFLPLFFPILSSTPPLPSHSLVPFLYTPIPPIPYILFLLPPPSHPQTGQTHIRSPALCSKPLHSSAPGAADQRQTRLQGIHLQSPRKISRASHQKKF